MLEDGFPEFALIILTIADHPNSYHEIDIKHFSTLLLNFIIFTSLIYLLIYEEITFIYCPL
jgi:hypothetical protein